MSADEDKPSRSGKRPDVDWAAIERDYRVGQLTVREIARQYGIAASSITRRAEKNGWARDFSDEIRAKTQAALLRNTESATPERNAPTREDLAVAVETNVSLVLGHRKGLARLRIIAEKLATQLDADSDDIKDIEEAIEEETAGDKNPERRNRMLKAVSLGSRAGIARELSQVLKNLIPLERQAFNLDEKGSSDPDAPTGGVVVHKIDPASAELLKRLVE